MERKEKQEVLPLDQMFREAEQYQFDLTQPPTPDEVMRGECPYHKAFVYECSYCNPK